MNCSASATVGVFCAARTAANAKRKIAVRTSIFILSPIAFVGVWRIVRKTKALTTEGTETQRRHGANQRLCMREGTLSNARDARFSARGSSKPEPPGWRRVKLVRILSGTSQD